jgi:hypothetical protein
VIDTWSRVGPVMRVCRSATAMEVIEALEEACLRYGHPKTIRSTRAASSRRRNSISGPMATVSSSTSAGRANRRIMHSPRATTPSSAWNARTALVPGQPPNRRKFSRRAVQSAGWGHLNHRLASVGG